MADEKKPLVPMIPVTSSNVRAIGYDDISHTLFVQFKGYKPVRGPQGDDSLYKYFYVQRIVYLKMLFARSKGKFVHWYLHGRYRYKKIGRAGWRGPRALTQGSMGVPPTKITPTRRKQKSDTEATPASSKKKKSSSSGKAKKSGRRKSTRKRRMTTKVRR